jgi:hypothetical protein
MLGAGNACSSLYKCDPNIPTGGGNKKQGITSTIGTQRYREIQTYSNGRGRFKLFFVNQLGGVGAGHTMFKSGGVKPTFSSSPPSTTPNTIRLTPNENGQYTVSFPFAENNAYDLTIVPEIDVSMIQEVIIFRSPYVLYFPAIYTSTRFTIIDLDNNFGVDLNGKYDIAFEYQNLTPTNLTLGGTSTVSSNGLTIRVTSQCAPINIMVPLSATSNQTCLAQKTRDDESGHLYTTQIQTNLGDKYHAAPCTITC